MLVNAQKIKSFVQQSPIESLLTKPVELGKINVAGLKLQTLQKDTFTSSSGCIKEALKVNVPKYTPLSSFESTLFENQLNDLRTNNFEGLEIVQNLSIQERKNLVETLVQDCNVANFVLVSTGNKPAVWIRGKLPEAFAHKNFDLIKFKKSSDDMIVLNRNIVKNVIKENFEIYQKRLHLDKNATVNEVYNVLKNPKIFKKCLNDAHDLVGLTLGYPRDCSLLFQLNMCDNSKILVDKELAKIDFKKILISKESPYKDFDNGFKNHLLCQIEKMNSTSSTEYLNTPKYSNAYIFNALVEEPEALNKILNSIRNACLKVKQINENFKNISSENKVA